MSGTVKSEPLSDADRSHKCDGREKVCWMQHFPLDKSHFITASCRVVEKAGFQYEGTLRRNAVKNGKVFDMKMYSLLKEEWNDN